MQKGGKNCRMLWGNRFRKPGGLLIKISILCFANKQDCGSLVLLVCIFIPAKCNALVLCGTCSNFSSLRIMQMWKFLRHSDIFINTEQKKQGRKFMLSYGQLNVFLLILSLYSFSFSVATADLNLAAQCLRKLTASVLAIRNAIILKGFRTVKGMHIKRKVRMIYLFATQTTEIQ